LNRIRKLKQILRDNFKSLFQGVLTPKNPIYGLASKYSSGGVAVVERCVFMDHVYWNVLSFCYIYEGVLCSVCVTLYLHSSLDSGPF